MSRPAEAEATKRIAPAPTVVKHVVKKFSEFRVVRKWWENTRFSPENAKNKAENDSFSALFGLSDKTWTCGLYHPKVARYQLRHTQMPAP